MAELTEATSTCCAPETQQSCCEPLLAFARSGGTLRLGGVPQALR